MDKFRTQKKAFDFLRKAAEAEEKKWKAKGFTVDRTYFNFYGGKDKIELEMYFVGANNDTGYICETAYYEKKIKWD